MSKTRNSKNIFNSLTINEKISLLNGESFWKSKHIKKYNIPSIVMSDGPHGIRKARNYGKSVPATCFPCSSLLACSFNDELMYEVGQGIAKEAIIYGIDIILGPGVNLKRHPFGGRNFEYFSEDPILSGYLASAYINGVSSMGVSACLKHYALNNMELNRMIIDEIIDEETLRNLYLKPFEIAIRESNVECLMTSYNKINGIHAGENDLLINKILREQFKFDGLVISDWGGTHNILDTIRAGSDIQMPHVNGFNKYVLNAYKNNLITDDDIKNNVLRILNFALKTKNNNSFDKKETFNDNHLLAIKAALDSIVLLKNEQNLLPLHNQRINVIGPIAKFPKIQGAGSSLINTKKAISFLDTLSDSSIGYEYYQGYDFNNKKLNKKLLKELDSMDNEIPTLIFVSLPNNIETEGKDLTSLKLTKEIETVINKLCEKNDKLILIIASGNPIRIPHIESIKSIIYLGLGGEGAYEALKSIIFGIVSPSGKLAQTYVMDENIVISNNYIPKNNDLITYYKEKTLIGYRDLIYFDREPVFCFGHGLTYTKFAFENFNVNQYEDEIHINLNIKNVGDYPGKEVIQIYVQFYYPYMELKGYEKVSLRQNEEKNVTIIIKKQDLKIFENNFNEYYLFDGDYEFIIATSVKNILYKQIVHISSKHKKEKTFQLENDYHLFQNEQKKFTYNLDSKIVEFKTACFMGRIIYHISELAVFFEKIKKNGNAEMIKSTILDAPIRNITMSGLSYQFMLKLIKKANNKN